MRNYLDNMGQKDPHERRAHALRVASVVTGLVFVGWIGTLGMRLSPETVAEAGNTDQTAAVVQTQQRQGPALEVSTSSVFLPTYNQ